MSCTSAVSRCSRFGCLIACGALLEVLATLVEAYEQKHFPIDAPDPIEAISSGWSNQACHPRISSPTSDNQIEYTKFSIARDH